MSFSYVAVGSILTTLEQGTGPVSSQQVRPEVDAWVAAVYTSAEGGRPSGSGVAIADRRVLTCAHVVMADGLLAIRPDPEFLWQSLWQGGRPEQSPSAATRGCEAGRWPRQDLRHLAG
jgi:hypothetical protein